MGIELGKPFCELFILGECSEVDITEAEVEVMLDEIDEDDTGEIDFAEFIQFAMKHCAVEYAIYTEARDIYCNFEFIAVNVQMVQKFTPV